MTTRPNSTTFVVQQLPILMGRSAMFIWLKQKPYIRDREKPHREVNSGQFVFFVKKTHVVVSGILVWFTERNSPATIQRVSGNYHRQRSRWQRLCVGSHFGSSRVSSKEVILLSHRAFHDSQRSRAVLYVLWIGTMEPWINSHQLFICLSAFVSKRRSTFQNTQHVQ